MISKRSSRGKGGRYFSEMILSFGIPTGRHEGVIRKRERGHAHACLWLCAARHALVCRTPFMLDPNIASSDQHRLLRVVSRQQRRESRRITCNCLPVSPVAGPCSQREHAELTSNHCKPRLTKPNQSKTSQEKMDRQVLSCQTSAEKRCSFVGVLAAR